MPTADEGIHELLILGLGDDSLDQGGAFGLDELPVPILGVGHLQTVRRPVPDLLVQQVDEPDDGVLVSVDGEEQRLYPSSADEDALADRDRLVEVRTLAVEVGDDDRPGHPDEFALVPQACGGGVDPVHG